MNRGYVRAHLERADADKPLRFVAATEGRKGDGIDLRMKGARLERYLTNPVVGYGHMYWGRNSLPIGRSPAVEVEGDRLLMEVEFDEEDDFAQQVERKYRKGYMNAVSIGFDIHEWENENDNPWRGGVATDWELVELSAVPIPMDASAVVESGRSLRDDFGRLLEQIPLDPAVQVERDSVTLTRSVSVTEDLIRQADPLLLSAAIGRALATAPTIAPAPEPAPAEPPEPAREPEPPAEETTESLRAERDAALAALAEAEAQLEAAAPSDRGAIPSHDTKVVEGEWDGPKAVAKAPNDERVLRHMHAWVDPNKDASTKAAYKFPHHAPQEGSPANLPAVRNALARLPQSDIPEEDRAAVERHLRNHLSDQDDGGREHLAPEGAQALLSVLSF